MTKLERLLAKTDMPDGCWIWKGAKHPHGYGRLRTGPRGESHVEMAHRAMWEAVHGPIVGSVGVLHHCDTPACVRPDHLYLGSPADNARDRDVRGRTRAKLTEVDVRLARAAHANGVRLTDLSKHFGVSPATMSDVLAGRSWRHVT